MKRWIATFLVSNSLLVTTISSASAHTALLSSSPRSGSIVKSWPAEVSITFNEKLLTIAGKAVNTISIKDSSGHRLENGISRVKGSTVAVSTRSGTHVGKFAIQYRVVSADGHPVTGTFVFTVKK